MIENEWTGWGDGLPVCIDRVTNCWVRALRYELPWSAMVHDDVTGDMRRVTIELVNAGGDHDEEARRFRLVAAAREHGQFRRAQRCQRSVLACEFTLLCDAIIGALSPGGQSFALARDVVGNLVPEIRLARRAAERGFDGRTKERANGAW